MTTPRRIIALGDSLAYGAGDETGEGLPGRLKSELPGVTTVNMGVNGAQTADVLDRIHQPHNRKPLSDADAIVLSVGANDLFRTPGAREATLRDPMAVASRILDRIETIVRELHTINPDARILILGGYNPVPTHPFAFLIHEALTLWDNTLGARFANDDRIAVVKMFDVVTPARLSRIDHFHPGGAAYREAAKRIAAMLKEQKAA